MLFNNAGFNRPMHLLDVTEENWHSIMDVNALGTLIGIQEGAKRMIPQRAGKIVNTSSIAGRQGYPSFAPYCASKFAVNALTQAAARGLAEHNITCNAFAPGVVDTPLWTQLDADLLEIGDAETPGQAMADFSAGILRGRPATPGRHRRYGAVPRLVRLRLPHRPGRHGRRRDGSRLMSSPVNAASAAEQR